LIAWVVTITPLPLLYHVRIFYIARYTFSTTHSSQPTYAFDELQKKEKKKKQKEGNKKETKTKNIQKCKKQKITNPNKTN